MTSGNPNSGGSPSGSGFDYRSPEDDAWYGVGLVLHNDTLTITYSGFSSACDEQFNAGDFKSLQEIDDFQQRFRKTAVQLQDRECSKLVEGIMVCATHHDFEQNVVHFYDAFVEEILRQEEVMEVSITFGVMERSQTPQFLLSKARQVENKEHSFAKGEEECSCNFILFWQHGPNAGNLTTTNIADICLIQWTAEIDPTLASFVKISREKLETTMHNSGSSSQRDALVCEGGTCHKEAPSSTVKHKSSLSQCGLQETKSSGQFRGVVRRSEGRISNRRERNEQDIDLGGEAFLTNSIKDAGHHYYILIENLEKDLSPSTVVEFIHKQTSISPQAYVFPSLSSEPYTRGAIVLDCEKKLEKIYEFLKNPDLVIMSARGRPWATTENKLRHGTFRISDGSLMSKSPNKSQDRNVEIGNKLKVVHSGTEEYRTAKLLRDLFMDFANHQQGLHKKLALEERKILQLSHAT